MRHTNTILIPSGSPVLGGGESREGILGQGTTEQRIVAECLLTISQLRLIESFLSDISARLRSAINPTCPINKLPPEVLTECFLHLAPYFPLTVGPSENQNEWIRVTHVCRYWRNVAINLSGLWDWIEFTRPEILEMYLNRSRSQQLSVCLQNVGPGYRQTVESKLKECGGVMLGMLSPLESRIHSLVIHKDMFPLRRSCQFLEARLPALETLSITSNTGWENESEDIPLARLRPLFRGGTPHLRRLFIPECTPWPNNDFKDLKLLCLYNQSALEEELPELLQMLRGSPNIEELYLRQHESSEWIEDLPPNLGPIFQARSLKRLRLHNFSPEAIVSILSTMKLQPNGVAVHISDTAMAKDTFGEIIPLFPPGCTLGSAEKLEVFHDSTEAFGIIFCVPGGSFKICGSLSSLGDEVPAISLFGYIFKECAQNLKELWIHIIDEGPGEGYILDGFSCFNLEELFLMGSVFGDLSDRLCEVLDPRNPWIRAAPRLRTLTVQGIREQPQLERLIELCEQRSKTDHPLHEVSVCSMEIPPPEWMTRLCSSAPTPVEVVPGEGWHRQMMELPEVCMEWTCAGWPSWDYEIRDCIINGYGY